MSLTTMASGCLFLDSCGDHYNTAITRVSKWNDPDTSGLSTGVTTNAGRYGNALNGVGQQVRNLYNNYHELIAGMGFYVNYEFTESELLGFYDNGTKQLYTFLMASGQIKVLYGTQSRTLGYTKPDLIRIRSWNYIELKAVFDSSAGYWEVRINSVQAASGIGPTIGTANEHANQVYIKQNYSIDDVYICSGEGEYNNSFMGDIGVLCLRPIASGSYTTWSPSGGANWECVDETTPDTIDFVYTNVVGNRDTYLLSSLPNNVLDVKAIQSVLYVSKHDSSDRAIGSVLYIGSTVYDGYDQYLFGNSDYVYYIQQFDINPDTGNPWTIGDINSLEAGIILTA